MARNGRPKRTINNICPFCGVKATVQKVGDTIGYSLSKRNTMTLFHNSCLYESTRGAIAEAKTLEE